MNRRGVYFLLLVFASSSGHAFAEPEPSPTSTPAPGPALELRRIRVRPTWDDGVRYELSTLHESPLPETWRLFPKHTLITGRGGGRLHVDAATFATTGDIPHIDADVGVRRAYVNADGEIALRWPIRYRLEVGLRSEEPYLAALWFEHRRPSGLALTVGQLDAPFSQERLTTSNTITFLERAQPVLGLRTQYQGRHPAVARHGRPRGSMGVRAVRRRSSPGRSDTAPTARRASSAV